jgi:hypothetical protein
VDRTGSLWLAGMRSQRTGSCSAPARTYLFADWQRRADFPTAIDAVIAAYQAEGLAVRVDLRLDTFARRYVADPDSPDDQHRVELVAN